MSKSAENLAMEQAVVEVIYCAGKSGKISVPGLELQAVKYASAKRLDVLDALKIAGEAIKRCCSVKEAVWFGYNAW
ncbi:MAG: hypothetical protein M0Z78_08840 [Betaproteobacteria bacterium]|nr:hypothetical protein [Betaproteobacteria bacterium]